MELESVNPLVDHTYVIQCGTRYLRMWDMCFNSHILESFFQIILHIKRTKSYWSCLVMYMLNLKMWSWYTASQVNPCAHQNIDKHLNHTQRNIRWWNFKLLLLVSMTAGSQYLTIEIFTTSSFIFSIASRDQKTWLRPRWVNTLRLRQNGRHFPDDIFQCIFLNENVWISIKISLTFFPEGPINNNPALVYIMAWCRPGDETLSEPMLVSLLMHICVTPPQWVKTHAYQ